MLRQGFNDLVHGGAKREPVVEVVDTPAGQYVAAVADSVGGGFSRVLHAAKVRHTEVHVQEYLSGAGVICQACKCAWC